jgi:hypothetical protein
MRATLLLPEGRNTINSYFDANGQACIQPNALRIHGKFMESTDWDDVRIHGKFMESTDWDDVKQRFAITDRQVQWNSRLSHTRFGLMEMAVAQSTCTIPAGGPQAVAGKGRDFISRSLESVVLILIQVEAAAVTAQANCSYCTSTGPTIPVHPGESLFHCKARP